MRVRKGEIVLIPFPFTDLKKIKFRPAIIVSNDTFNKNSNDCLMVPITSIIKEEKYSIIINNQNLSSGNLLKISRIRVDKIFCVEKKLITKRIARINKNTMEKINCEIIKLF